MDVVFLDYRVHVRMLMSLSRTQKVMRVNEELKRQSGDRVRPAAVFWKVVLKMANPKERKLLRAEWSR